MFWNHPAENQAEGTIVAASLAYVLTPDGHDCPVYSTVFILGCLIV